MAKSSVQPVLQKAEKHAKVLRDRAKVAPGEPLDPRAAAEELGIQVTYPNGNGHAEEEREYDEETEKEAYWTAAAALLPKKVVAMAVYNEVPASQLAARYGTSRELVEMRIKLLKLWSHYKND